MAGHPFFGCLQLHRQLGDLCAEQVGLGAGVAFAVGQMPHQFTGYRRLGAGPADPVAGHAARPGCGLDRYDGVAVLVSRRAIRPVIDQ
ncbi:hypothetical protein [Actinomadura violacea]|uniref:Uncharacterized protein n=1 Tax=Actinomadura violacea TaxID=2819934 RepID=A0ABS3RPY6_9ACTN|nr:hypothetical protein [Actinomadura violacea]MBO2458124.1 hypothetical protein [Actinomadura violacea]